MCGRYFLDQALVEGALGEIASELERRTGEPVKTGELFPGDRALALARAKDGGVKPYAMKWGWQPQKGRMLINARSETAADPRAVLDAALENPAFSDAEEEKK